MAIRSAQQHKKNGARRTLRQLRVGTGVLACTQHKKNGPRRTLRQQAKATLRHVRFSSGTLLRKVELSPRLSSRQKRQIEYWLERLPRSFPPRLPPLKLAAAKALNAVRRSVFINENPLPQRRGPREHPHAVSYIPERYIVLEASLFRRRVELGRILYHELCHFLWPRLGNPSRRRFQALLQQEMRQGARGELGHSAEYRKAHLRKLAQASARLPSVHRKMAEYFCESFCDTGSYILLGSQRRRRHSEYTLSKRARRRRCRAWCEIVLQPHGRPARARHLQN